MLSDKRLPEWLKSGFNALGGLLGPKDTLRRSIEWAWTSIGCKPMSPNFLAMEGSVEAIVLRRESEAV